jgi:hypothetical protein
MITKLFGYDDEETSSASNYFVRICKWVANTFPSLADRNTKTTNELKESLKFLEWGIEPYEVVIFSRFVLIASFILVILFDTFYYYLSGFSIILFSTSIVIPFILAYYITEFPKTQSTFEKSEALGDAPIILTQLVILLKQNPNLEKALMFVSQFSKGRLSKDIKRSLWKCMTGHRSSIKKELEKLAETWGKYLIELKRSIYLIIASLSERNDIKRNQTLDRAINISLEGIINRIKEYANELYLPTLFLFSFGTVLPLVIISLLPIFSFMGGEFSSPTQMFVLLIISLIGIYIYSNKILEKRPPSFSAIKLPERLPNYPLPGNLLIKIGNITFEAPAVLYSVLIFIVISFPGILYLLAQLPITHLANTTFANIINGFNTLTIIWGVGIAISVYAYGTSWYKKRIRDDVDKIEKEAIDGIYQLASRINEGRSPEEAIHFVAKTMPNTSFGILMKRTYDNIRTRHVTLEDAFFNEQYGSLKDIHSYNIKLIIKIFISSLKKGTNNCSQTLFTISNHYDHLYKTENKLKAMWKSK